MSSTRHALRSIVSTVARWKACVRNPAARFGRGCRVSWSARIKGGGPVTFGHGCVLTEGAILIPNGGFITMGCGCSIGPYVVLNGAAGLSIGNHVGIGCHSVVYTSSHVYDAPDVPILRQGTTREPVTIHDDVWIGAATVILGGVTIGRGAVVAAGAVVTRDVEPFTVVAGVPARPIRQRSRTAGGSRTPDARPEAREAAGTEAKAHGLSAAR